MKRFLLGTLSICLCLICSCNKSLKNDSQDSIFTDKEDTLTDIDLLDTNILDTDNNEVVLEDYEEEEENDFDDTKQYEMFQNETEQARLDREADEQLKKEATQREFDILLEIKSLGSQMRNKMPRIERLYMRYQQAKSNGILSDPYSEFDLNDALDEVLTMKRKQVELAKKLNDPQLVYELEQQLKQFQEARDQIFYGDYGRVPSIY